MLTTFDSDDLVLGALRAGALGFVLKDTPPAQILDAVRTRRGGQPRAVPGGRGTGDRRSHRAAVRSRPRLVPRSRARDSCPR